MEGSDSSDDDLLSSYEDGYISDETENEAEHQLVVITAENNAEADQESSGSVMEQANVEPSAEAGMLPQSDFDRLLPDQHTYLGESFTDLKGRTVFGDDEVVELYVPPQSIPPPVPGQVIPLAFFRSQAISTVKRVIQGHHTFAIISKSENEDLPKIGTTVEILRWISGTGIPGYGQFGLDFGLRAKAEARQRFKVLKTFTRRDGDSVHPVALVKILPEVPVTKMLNSYISGHIHRTKRLKQAHLLTSYPRFVFNLYDPDILLKKILVEVEKLFGGSEIVKTMPKLDTIGLCYWLMLQLPLSDSMRMELLGMNSVIQRLRAILSLLRESGQTVCCKHCGHLIARSCDTLAVSAQGPHGTFVNSGGYVHDTLTYTRAVGIQVTSRPSTEFSWFPGYAWQIVVCDSCVFHLGWKFTSKNLNPKQFICFTRSALDLQMSKENARLSECTWVM